MLLLFICAGLLFLTGCARPSGRSQLHNRAYENYGSTKIRGGIIAAFSFSILPNLDPDILV
jgi:hypothetical protein